MSDTEKGGAARGGLVHGGDVEGFVEEYGYAPLDFSANISPLGLPPGVRAAVIGALDIADAYPDPLCRKLREALARVEGVRIGDVVCGNGTADVIYRLACALRPKRTLLCAPTFADYEAGVKSVGSAVDHHVLDQANGFRVTEAFVDRIVRGTEAVFICQPNNPTGLTCSRAVIQAALARCEEVGAHLVIDECFVGFLDDPARVSVQGLLADHPSLIVLKAFTKLYAMAGIRLGYALCTDQDLVASIQHTGQPWAVSSLAQAAGIAALGEGAYVEELRALIVSERAFLIDGLASLGIKAQGEANFLFFHVNVDGFAARMRVHGVLVRDCSNYVGLEAGWYRIAVRGHEENAELLETIGTVLEGACERGERA